MSVPGHYEPSSGSDLDSDSSFSPAVMNHLEAIAQLSDDDGDENDPDWSPDQGQLAMLAQDDEDDDELDLEETDDDADPGGTHQEQQEQQQQGDANEERGALQIGYDRTLTLR